jgi:L-alanine-DL-glutamate epimerase-like enolase superfamily enzyme
MAASNSPEVRNGQLKVPEGPGLGLDLNEDVLRQNLAPGEEYWS